MLSAADSMRMVLSACKDKIALTCTDSFRSERRCRERAWVTSETPDETTADMLAVIIYAIEWQDDEPRIDYYGLWDRI